MEIAELYQFRVNDLTFFLYCTGHDGLRVFKRQILTFPARRSNVNNIWSFLYLYLLIDRWRITFRNFFTFELFFSATIMGFISSCFCPPQIPLKVRSFSFFMNEFAISPMYESQSFVVIWSIMRVHESRFSLGLISEVGFSSLCWKFLVKEEWAFCFFLIG